MTTSSWSTGSIHDSDANFRIWGKEISDQLQAMSGLVKTSDTGQINWTTVTRPGSSTDAGYEIYYLNDSLHGTAPIYFRIDYGTNSATTAPRVKLTVGTSTNGAGTIGGIATAARTWNGNNVSTSSAYASYLCVVAGFVGLGWKVDVSATWGGFFAICRSCDADGTPNIKAAHVSWGASGSNIAHQTLRFESTAAAQTLDTAGHVSMAPGGVTTGFVSGTTYQVYQCWMNAPDVRPIFGMCAVFQGDFGVGSTLSVALVGTTARTYVALITQATGALVRTGTNTAAMLYE